MNAGFDSLIYAKPPWGVYCASFYLEQMRIPGMRPEQNIPQISHNEIRSIILCDMKRYKEKYVINL
jgi:hypothetical protein